MSRKIIGIMFMVFCVCGAAQAQIVLNPPASVGSNSASMSQDIGWMFTQFCDGMTTNMFSSWVNSLFGGFSYNLKLSGMYSSDPLILDSSIHCTSSTYYSNFCVISFYQNHKNSKSSFPVIEFDISSLSGAGVTEENFQSAYIDGLQVTATSGDITKATINDLVSWYQNGYNDHWGYIGERPFTYITDLFNTAPSVGTIFNDIDVTAAVYEDLFGA
ncbi:hypothetical protein JXQ70_06585, partial [bacterium]|nr:hypothetical protein [bacterium]